MSTRQDKNGNTTKRTLRRIAGAATLALTTLLAGCGDENQQPCSISGVCAEQPAFRHHQAIAPGTLIPDTQDLRVPCTPEDGEWDYTVDGPTIEQTAKISDGTCELKARGVAADAYQASALIEIQGTTDERILSRTLPLNVTAMTAGGDTTTFSRAERWSIDYASNGLEGDVLQTMIRSGEITGRARIADTETALGESQTIAVPNDAQTIPATRWQHVDESTYTKDSPRMISREEAVSMVGEDAVDGVEAGDTLEILSVVTKEGMARPMRITVYDPCKDGAFTSSAQDGWVRAQAQQQRACTYLNTGHGIAHAAFRQLRITSSDQEQLVGATMRQRVFAQKEDGSRANLTADTDSEERAEQVRTYLGHHQTGYGTDGTLPFYARNGGVVFTLDLNGASYTSRETMEKAFPAAQTPTTQIDWHEHYETTQTHEGPRIATPAEIQAIKPHPEEER